LIAYIFINSGFSAIPVISHTQLAQVSNDRYSHPNFNKMFFQLHTFCYFQLLCLFALKRPVRILLPSLNQHGRAIVEYGFIKRSLKYCFS